MTCSNVYSSPLKPLFDAFASLYRALLEASTQQETAGCRCVTAVGDRYPSAGNNFVLHPPAAELQ
jgi:hypothetical protein